MLPGAPVKEITLSRRVGFVRFGYSRRGTKWPGVGECPVPFVFATCLKTSPSSLFSSPSFSLRLRIYEEETDQGDGEGEAAGTGKTPDPLIARHSCPFVRHLIASRGSRGILRGGYLRFLLSLVQLHGARLGIGYTFRGHRCPSICPLQNLASACS